MAERKKPRTKEELQADIEGHPDRGKIDGKSVVADGYREIRGRVSAETKRKFMRIIACYGVGMSEGLHLAIAALWREQQEAVKSHEQEKAEEFGVTPKEIQIKAFGHYKQRGRAKRLNLENNNDD